MPVYEYTVFDEKGKKRSGIIDADSALTARQKLRAKGTFPISVAEVKVDLPKKGRDFFSGVSLFSQVKPAEISMMTRQLSTLLEAGFPLVSALNTLIPQSSSQPFQKMLSQIKDAIEEGNSFAGALSQYPNLFTPIYINMIRAGETSGTLEIVLERLADITESQQQLKHKIKSTLAYPFIMTILGTVVLFFLLTYIVPTLTSLFSDMQQALPGPTLFLIAVGDLLAHYWWALLMVIVVVGIVFNRVKKTSKGRNLIDMALLKLPWAGNLIQKIAVARFCRTLGSLTENGVSMLAALGIVQNIVGNTLIAAAVQNAAWEVEKGRGLGVALAESASFPHLAIQMIQVGEQTGRLDSMLMKIASVYENEVETTLVGLTALLEPIIILVMGVVIGFIILSICLPIFEMNQLVH